MRSPRVLPSSANCSTGCTTIITPNLTASHLLFLPVWFLIPNLVVTALVFALLFGWSVVGSAMFGVALAIFHYEWVHYVAHIPYQPRTAFGRWIKQYHLRHHFISEKFWFGVSNPSMDLLGGTYKEAREVERSGTTRKLYG